MRRASVRTATPTLPVCLLASIAVVAACSGSPATDNTAATPVPTFNEHVAPLVFDKCSGCHRPGQGTPFSLLTYDDVAGRAAKVGRAVARGHMPPWLPEKTTYPFADERRLTPDQVQTITRWVAGGTPEGPRDLRRRPPTFPDGWQLGTPDLVVSVAKPYLLPTGGTDVFRNLVLRVPLHSARHVRAVEFDAAGAPVHHAVVHIDRTGSSRRLDGADGQVGFEGMGARDAQDPDGHFLGWAPGRGPIEMPDRMPWRLDPGTDLVIEMHLVPGMGTVNVAPRVALYFTDMPPVAQPFMLRMGSKAIDIPAGDPNYAVMKTFTVPADVELLSLYPHAHYLGKEMVVEAERPDGQIDTLLRIPRWNFRWQQDYRFRTPVTLPKGTVVRMRFTYDNSAANDANPSKPPTHVLCGQRTTDEMGNLGLQLVARKRADLKALSAAARAFEVEANLEGALMLVRNNAANAENQTFLAASLVDAGRPQEALAHLDLATRLDPGAANTYNELGGVYLALGRTTDALGAFRRAAELAPNDDRLAFNLGGVLASLGRSRDAERAYRQAIQLNPNYADAFGELGVLAFAAGRTSEAITHLTRASSLSPDTARFHSDLGGALAQSGKFKDALAHVRRALELDPEYEPALENLRRLNGRK
jgi:Flp pilus assembly protein TadD